MTPQTDDETIQELKHDTVPGYPKAFLIACGVMIAYLAIILLTSPGPAKGHHGDEKDHHAEDSHSTHDAEESKSH